MDDIASEMGSAALALAENMIPWSGVMSEQQGQTRPWKPSNRNRGIVEHMARGWRSRKRTHDHIQRQPCWISGPVCNVSEAGRVGCLQHAGRKEMVGNKHGGHVPINIFHIRIGTARNDGKTKTTRTTKNSSYISLSIHNQDQILKTASSAHYNSNCHPTISSHGRSHTPDTQPSSSTPHCIPLYVHTMPYPARHLPLGFQLSRC